MRNNVVFQYAGAANRDFTNDGILSVVGAKWFTEVLGRVPGIQIDRELCQEDWGVVFFATRNRKHFWIGMSTWPEDAWLVHVHHGSFAWLQRILPSGRHELAQLMEALHSVLLADAKFSHIEWFSENDMRSGTSHGARWTSEL